MMFNRLALIFSLFFLILTPYAAQCRVMLGIDMLQATNFEALRGKRVGLLTHPAGVNNSGRPTVEVLYGAKNVNLVALFGPEHGIYGNEKADVPIADKIDPKTNLSVYSLYGKYRKPTPEMLKKIDTMVIDLQDVGSRSYTYVSCMIRTMEACFEQGKEVIILDRPNPIGGLKVDGPMLDMEYKSYVGMLPVPYVHGLTIGELAMMAKANKGWLDISEKARKQGKLRVVKMAGWRRDMQWPDTNLKWTPTSPAIPSYAAAMGYAMTGLGCQLGGFQHGYGGPYPFRLLSHPKLEPEQLAKILKSKNIAGLSYKPIMIKDGKSGVYIMVDDWEKLRPTEISFHLMTIACELDSQNPFASTTNSKADLFNKHTGSKAWWQELVKRGKYAPVDRYVIQWDAAAKNFQKNAKKFWLYN